MVNNDHATNTTYYEHRYRAGYGLEYPEGHVIRFHHHILEYELGMTGGTVMDYGCGTGSHLEYFKRNGYEPYGCDINEAAVAECKGRLPNHAANFHVVPSVPHLADYFSGQFDLIFSNQTLYFINDTGIDELVAQFYDMLRPGGIFFATMMAPTHYFSKYAQPANLNGLSKVDLRGRLEQTCYINFKTRESTLRAFSPFTKLHMGSYSHTIREDEGATDHHIFVGQKL